MVHNSIFKVQEVELIYKSKFRSTERPKITKSQDSYNILLEGWNQEIMGFIEEFKILLLSRANRVLGLYEMSSGGMNGTVADPKLIFAAALKAGASGIILAHNHPSGNLKPSEQDIQLTRKIKEGGKILEIDVLDHIILSDQGYYSFSDEGLM